MLLAAAPLFSYAGWAALAFAMLRHHHALFHRPPGRAAAVGLRVAGAAQLGLAFALCVATEGWAVGPVAWAGGLTAGALAMLLLLSFRPWAAAVAALPAAVGAALLAVN